MALIRHQNTPTRHACTTLHHPTSAIPPANIYNTNNEYTSTSTVVNKLKLFLLVQYVKTGTRSAKSQNLYLKIRVYLWRRMQWFSAGKDLTSLEANLGRVP